MTDSQKDQEIITLLGRRSTEQAAFQLLYSTYSKRLYWHIRRMVGNHEDADDVLQDVLVKAWKAIKNFRGDSKLSTWLYRIATNQTLTFLEKRSKRQTTSIDADENFIDEQLRAETNIDGDEVTRKLASAIETLPEKQRLVFNMRYYDELAYNEISEIVGTSVGGLKASFHHAVTKIEKFLTEND